MKHTLQTLTSRFLGVLWLVASVCILVSCSDDTDEAGGNFKLYYPDMTDIGPSMTGVKIPAPSFQGATPSEFTIASVTLNDEAIETDCFVIDEATGEITINSTAETAVGEYKLTVACSAAGRYFTFKDIIKVTFLPRAPEGTVADPNNILVMYSVVSDPNNITKLPTAQVKTEGEHVSITKYSIGTVTANGEVVEKPEEMFEVSASGEISIIKSNRFQRGVTYLVSLKLETAATGDTPCIASDILAVEVASEPFSLVYPDYSEEWKMPNASNDEGGSSFTSETPVFVGSTDGIKYWIEIDNEKGKDKILIDETTGVISVPQGHGFDVEDKFNIDVFVANTYLAEGKKLATLKLEVTKFYKPLTDNLVFYTATTAEQTDAFTINTANWLDWGYSDLKFDLLGGWESRLTINPTTGAISAEEDNSIVVGEYNVPFRVTNGDGTNKEYSFKLTIKENTQKFIWIKCGHNYGSQYVGEEYENQFRFNSISELQNFTTTIRTNLDGVKTISWSITSLVPTLSDTSIGIGSDNKTLKITSTLASFSTAGSVHIAALTGTVDGRSITVPIFVNCNVAVGGYNIEYTPFVFRVNPKNGGTSVKPNITGTTITDKFALDYRRSFNYYTIGSNGKITTEAITKDNGTFITALWQQNDGLSSKGAETKAPLGFYNGANLYDLTKNHLGYVDNNQGSLQYTVKILPDVWKVGSEYANGFFKGQMTFVEDYSEGKINNGSQIFPLMIWLDPDYYPVTE